MSSVMNYEDNILTAIQMMVDNAVEHATYDKTIQATIKKVVDPTIGKYRIMYQDSAFYAYATSIDVTYSEGTNVYVLIPGNDMSKTKTILGTVDNLGVDFINILTNEERYENLGVNIAHTSSDFSLNSYISESILALYDRTNNINLIGLNVNDAEMYLKQNDYFTLGAYFKTNLPSEQRTKGNYGISFKFVYADENNHDVEKTYTIDLDSFNGDPYNLSNYLKQTSTYDNYDKDNFKYIESITIFENGFPYQDPSKPNDIFIKDIQIFGARKITEDELASNMLSILTPQGTYFTAEDSASATKTLKAQIRIKGKIASDYSNTRFYWFRENAAVTKSTNADKYCSFGSSGWECLNAKEATSDNESEWIPADDTFTIIKSDLLTKETKYKCVALYNNGDVTLSREITIYNKGAATLSIESSAGTQFYFGTGTTTLTCSVTPALSNLTYKWGKVDIYGAFTEINNATSATLTINASDIDRFNIYKCQVDSNNNYCGTASISLYNSLDKTENTRIIINNGSQVFKYNTDGIAPNSQSLEKPIAILPLSFKLFDDEGAEIPDEKIAVSAVQWLVPANNTLLDIPNIYGAPTVEGDWLVYSNTKEFSFNILRRYDAKKINNTIRLRITLGDNVSTVDSNLIFIKEGERGSNGTNFVCKVVPNTSESIEKPIVTINNNTATLNYTAANNKWFKVQLWRDGEQLFNSTESGQSSEDKAVTVTWSVLKNTYSSSINDDSNITINATTGVVSCNTTTYGHAPANIIQCKVVYDGVEYYDNIPITIIRLNNSNYNISLKEFCGFSYAIYESDGRNPQYDNSTPFEVIVKNNGTDISLDDDTSYAWAVVGSYYEGGSYKTVENLILVTSYTETVTLTKNQKRFKPIDTYDGLCLTNAIVCAIAVNSTQIGTITIPIDLYINRYGNAALNNWNGSSIQIRNDEGIILSPQIGAGKKETDNTFTGMFMGDVEENATSDKEIGLFGYYHGQRTIELNAETGTAKFGATNKSQIILDPKLDSAKICSGDFEITYVLPSEMNPPQTVYTEGFKYIRVKNNGDVILLKQKPAGSTPLEDNEYRIGDSFKVGDRVWVNGAGLEIDLNDPPIMFGNGNFRVDSDGQIYATGFVTVKELEEGDYNIPGVNVFNVDYTNDTVQFEANAQLYPIGTNPIQKTITLNCLFKDLTTTNYTTYLLDSNGDPITTYPYPSANTYDANGLRINITQASVSGQAVITFIANTNQAIASTVNSYKFRFTHPNAPSAIVVDKLFYANLVVKGTSVSIKGGPYANVAALCAAHGSGNTLGDGYTVGESNAHLYVFTNGNSTGGSDPGDWSDVGQIQGAPGQDGTNAKGLYISATADIFKKASGESSYSPTSITITPFFQNTTFNKWYYNDGTEHEIDLSSLPGGITYNSNTKALTIPNNSSLYTSSISVLTFKCTTVEEYATSQPYYNTISIGRVDDGLQGAPGINGKTIWVTSTAPTYSNNKYIMQIANLVGPNKTPEVGEIIIYNNRYQYPITTVNTTTVEATTQYDMKGPQGNNTAVVSIYKRNASTPTTPTYSSSDNPTYTFSTHTLSVAPTGWSTTMPAATTGTELYVSSIVVYGNTDLIDIDTSVVWATPTQITEKGMDGTSPFYGYLTNEVQSFAADVAGATASTELHAYSGSTEKAVQIKTVGIAGQTAVTASTSYQTITGLSWLQFKVNYTTSVNGPQITFETLTGVPQSTSGQIIITYRVSGESSDRTIYFAYSTTTKGANGQDAKGLNIEPSALLFKMKNDGSSYEPTSITLTPNPQNTTFGYWYYNGTQIAPTGSGSATNVDGVSLNTSTNVLTISYSSTEFNSHQSMTFEGRDSSGIIKDSATITKISNPKNTFIRYSNQASGHTDMTTDPTGCTYIGVATTESTNAPTDPSAYTWSKYVGSDGNGISDITYKYQATSSQSAPSASGTGWVNDISNTTFSATNKYLWQKEVIDYTSITDKTTVSLIAVWGEKGADTLNVILTNESQSIAGDATKAIPGRSYYTDIKGYLGSTLQTITIGSITSTQGLPTGMNVSITNNNTDHPRVTFTIDNNTTMDTLDGQITIPVTINQTQVDKIFSYSLSLKGNKGDDGADGNNTATISLYTRSASDPSKPYSSGSVTYTFATQELSDTLPSGWYRTVPTGTNPLYVSSVSVTANTATVSIGYNDWSTPTKVAQNGTNGTNGYNTATISIYQRAATKPSVSYSGNKTYTFSSHSLDSLPDGWSISAPTTDGNPLWVSSVSVSSRSSSVSIAASAWTEATTIAEDGQNGQDGANGYNTATISMYGRFSSTPSVPYSSAVTYTFSDQGLSANPGTGWYRTAASIPSTENGKPLYVSSASVSANTATVSIAANKWSTPYIIAEDGEDGNDGEDAITLKIEASGATIFKNSQGNVTLTAHVYKGETEQTINNNGTCGTLGTIYWYKDGTKITNPSKTYIVYASNVDSLSYITCKLEENLS